MSAEFDKAIDAAVREMLDVEPPADLRERVIASVFTRNRAASRRNRASASPAVAASDSFTVVASAFRRNRVVFAAAAAAAILVAVFVARRGEPVAPQAPIVARGGDIRLPAPIVTPVPRGVTVAAAPIRTAPAPLRGIVAATSYAGDDSGVADMAPLATITPISIAPIAQDSIAPASMTMAPLKTITDVQIAPLTPPDGRH